MVCGGAIIVMVCGGEHGGRSVPSRRDVASDCGEEADDG